MADSRDRKTGLGVDAFFQTEEPPQQRRTRPVRQQRQTSDAPKQKKTTRAKSRTQHEAEPAEQLERRTAWLREDHLLRLEQLKIKERRRLKRQKKRVSMTTLIDEALEAYLKAKGA